MIAAVKKRRDDAANDPFQQTQQFTAYGELKGLGLKTAITVERKLLSVHQGDNNFSCCEGKKKKKRNETGDATIHKVQNQIRHTYTHARVQEWIIYPTPLPHVLLLVRSLLR